MMTLKMNLLGGAVALVKDTFARNRDYNLPLNFQTGLDIDILAIDTEVELETLVRDTRKWTLFWECFADCLNEGLL